MPNSAPRLPAGLLLVLLGALGTAGCDSRMSSLSDSELQDRVRECDATRNQSPGMAISCDNFRRECRKRREQGRYVC